MKLTIAFLLCALLCSTYAAPAFKTKEANAQFAWLPISMALKGISHFIPDKDLSEQRMKEQSVNTEENAEAQFWWTAARLLGKGLAHLISDGEESQMSEKKVKALLERLVKEVNMNDVLMQRDGEK